MGSRFLFLLHQNNQLLTIQTINESLIVASTHKDDLQKLMLTLKEHKAKTNKWLNRCRMYNENVLHLTEQNMSTDDSLIQMAYLDMNDEGCVQTLHNMYYIHGMRVFLMSEYNEGMYEPETPLLSIQGLTLQKGPSQDNEDFMNIYQYLDFIYNSN